jgi:hypothetical protein
LVGSRRRIPVAEGVRALARVNEARPGLSCRRVHRATTTHCLASVPALRDRLGQNSAQVSIGRGVAARRRDHATGPVAVADDRPHPRARAARTMRPANFFGRGRLPREPPIRVGPACRTGTLQSRSCQCTHARHGRCVGPHRLTVAGRTEHVHIAEAMPATSRRSISRRSTFHPHEPAWLQPHAVPTEIQP